MKLAFTCLLIDPEHNYLLGSVSSLRGVWTGAPVVECVRHCADFSAPRIARRINVMKATKEARKNTPIPLNTHPRFSLIQSSHSNLEAPS